MTHRIFSRRAFLLTATAGTALVACSGAGRAAPATGAAGAAFPDNDWLAISEADWRTRLSPAAFNVLRKHDTERPFTSPLNDEKRPGTYHCAGCDLPLFSSEKKFDSGTGWPSFWEPLPGALGTSEDRTLIFVRTEYHCARCIGHQGHVFDDGPAPTGLRYCNNGVALAFKAA